MIGRAIASAEEGIETASDLFDFVDDNLVISLALMQISELKELCQMIILALDGYGSTEAQQDAKE
jgi:hypothetical protein